MFNVFDVNVEGSGYSQQKTISTKYLQKSYKEVIMYQPVTDKDQADLWNSFEHLQNTLAKEQLDNLNIDFVLW